MLPIYKEKKESTQASPKKPAQPKKKGKDGSIDFNTPGNKIHFISLGCPRNLVDTEVMLGILLKAGFEPEQEMKKADFIVINTCGFLQASRDESLSCIGEAMDLRKKGAKVIVTGCMVQRHSEEVKEHFPKVDYMLGSGDVEGILKAVSAEEQGSMITSAKSFLEAGEVPRQLSTPKHFAYLKIAEGCRKKCAYCVIPNIKGPLKSKTVEQVMKEFRILRGKGVEEIILIAQDLGDYAKDMGMKKSDGLVMLLKEILKEEGDFWLRLLYLYPDEITDELLDLMNQDKRLLPYLDMPIQHINNRVLKSMRRATSKEEIENIIATLRAKVKDVTIRTSLIVGFPGETDAEFEDLLNFVTEWKLDNVGVFKYSNEEGSHAYTMEGQIAEDVKEKRYARLMEAQAKALEERQKRYIGKTIDVFVEGYHPETDMLMIGRHKGQCPDIDGSVIINDGRKVTAFGKRYRVKITETAGYDLIGKVL